MDEYLAIALYALVEHSLNSGRIKHGNSGLPYLIVLSCTTCESLSASNFTSVKRLTFLYLLLDQLLLGPAAAAAARPC